MFQGKRVEVMDQRHQQSRVQLEGGDDERLRKLIRQYQPLMAIRVRPWYVSFKNRITYDELMGAAIVGLWKADRYAKSIGQPLGHGLVRRFVRFELALSVRQSGLTRGRACKITDPWEQLTDYQAPTDQRIEARDVAEVSGGLLTRNDFENLMARYSGNQHNSVRATRSLNRLKKELVHV